MSSNANIQIACL